ncbi:cation transporter dimerization domain-containing protein, partial [Staphylococcus sp. SIMBA_130]
PAEIQDKIYNIVLKDEDVVDIKRIRMIQEGRLYHVEGTVELKKGLSLDEADDIKYRLRDVLLREPEVADVLLGIVETDDIKNWNPEEKK